MAFIRQITIQGFKSFSPRKMTLNLNRGFTAIVGENGCGKSNILDAVCFVLGRLSSKSLRAENFASLLYNGSDGNAPAKFCRVSLIFDNTDRQFPIDADEVSVSREVDQSGISAYRIGGKRCTRTELLDTIAVAGLHPEGHNIVMQNELANVIRMSPSEIRQIVEGVAGISVFDEKKRQIELELEKVDKNLQMVQMRTEEIRQEYSRLERDRTDALRWQEITDQLSQLQRDLAFAELARVELRLQEMKTEFQAYSNQIKQLEKQRNECRQRKTELEKSVIDNGAKIKRLDRKLHSKEIEATRLREKLKGVELTSNKITRQLESQTSSFEHTSNLVKEEKTGHNDIKKQISELQTEETRLKNQITPLRQQLSEISQATSEPDKQYMKLRKEILVLTESIEKKRSEFGETQAFGRVTHKRISDLKSQIKQSVDLLPEQEEELQAAQNHYETLQKELQKAKDDLTQGQEQEKIIHSTVLEHQSKQDKLAQLLQSTREELLEAKTRLKTIRELKKFGPTRKATIQAVLNFVKKNKVQGVHGTLGSLGKTSTEYATALEIAGGSRLDYIVVDDEETATKCIEHLKKSRIGRATFIPLDTIKVGQASYKGSSKGVIGNAIDLLSFEERFRPAFEYAFGRTVIVKNLNIARKVDAPGLRKITIDGDVIDHQRILTGGYYKGISSLTLEEEARIPELQKKIKDLQELQTTSQSDYKEWRTKLNQIEEQIMDTQKTIADLENQSIKAAEIVAQREEAINVFKASIQKLENSLAEDEIAKQTLDEKQQKAQEEINELVQNREELQNDLTELERTSLDPNLSHVRNQLDKFESQLQEIQLKLTEKRGEARYHQAEIKRLEKDLKELSNQQKQTQQELQTSESEKTIAQTELTKLEQTLSTLEIQIQTLEETLSANESEQQQLTQTIEDVTEKISEEKMSRSKLEGRLEQWEERFASQKEKVEGLEPPLAPIDGTEVHSLRRQVSALEQEREALGLINQKAVERFEEVRHAFDEILEKERHIHNEREAILDAMKRAEEEKFRVFMASFSGISQNFSTVYQQLTSGEGQLELENPENPFLGGIRMKVRPAGKRVQYLDALSGGEKALTALTFMFALQLHQPAPFYFLDEIDEALDPNNAERVAKLIEELSRNSQFLIISHNEITIRVADTLLGVAMVDDVSKVFAIKFEEGLLLIDGRS